MHCISHTSANFTRHYYPVDMHLSKALFPLDPDNLLLHCFLGLGTMFCCSFFCSLEPPCKTLQMLQVTPYCQPEKHILRELASKSYNVFTMHSAVITFGCIIVIIFFIPLLFFATLIIGSVCDVTIICGLCIRSSR